ncbi:TetR/AcrR family transcriptional regulator [soil metagenome]
MAVAAHSFLERGYAGTTMSGIAATLGGSKGTLWKYFSSKEDLFAAVIDHATSAYRVTLSEILEGPSADLAATLTRFCVSIVQKVTSPQAVALHRLVMAEAGRFPEMGRIFYDRAPRQTHMLLGTFLQRAIDRHELRNEEEPVEMARMLVSLCLAGSQQKLLVGLIDSATPELMAADVDRAMKLFMRAYAI